MTTATHRPDPVAVMRGVSKTFDSGDGIQDIDLEVDPGTIFGFIGPSGSGKTTTVRMLTSILEPTTGSVEVFGQRPTDFQTATRNRIGYMPQRSVLYPNLSVWENLRFFASIHGIGRDHGRLQRILEFVELADHASKKVADTSGGMQRRLSLASALVHHPELIFLDEPTAGIDPVLRRKLWDHFEELRDQGRTLFVTTQYVGEAAYCDRVGVLADGRLLLVDTPDGLRTSAFGGEVIDVEFVRPPTRELLDELARTVSATHSELLTPTEARLVVDDASDVLPQLGTWSGDQKEIRGFEQYLPPFDDVFVELIERHRSPVGAEREPANV